VRDAAVIRLATGHSSRARRARQTRCIIPTEMRFNNLFLSFCRVVILGLFGLSEITSLSRACHNLEGSLATHESKFLSENPVVFPAAGKGRSNLSIFPRPYVALVEQIVRNLRRPRSESALQERKIPISSNWLCAA